MQDNHKTHKQPCIAMIGASQKQGGKNWVVQVAGSFCNWWSTKFYYHHHCQNLESQFVEGVEFLALTSFRGGQYEVLQTVRGIQQ